MLDAAFHEIEQIRAAANESRTGTLCGRDRAIDVGGALVRDGIHGRASALTR